MKIGVIGSGPAGIACAKALVRRGLNVVILDAGEVLDADRRALVDRLSSVRHSEWTRHDFGALLENPTVLTQQVPKKVVFGSDYIFARDDAHCPVEGSVLASPTLAKGGFGVAWGGAVLPPHPDDLADWPFDRSALDASLRRILSSLPISAQDDSLSGHFPLLCEPAGSLKMPRQAMAFERDFRRAARCDAGHRSESILCGQARLAVRTQTSGQDKGCVYCGACLSGCVYQSIFAFDREVDILSRDGVLEYVPGVVVRSVHEDAQGVVVRSVGMGTSAPREDRFAKVFVAAGALNSARIVLESRSWFGRPLDFLECQKFILPILRMQRDPVEWPAINSLAALFIEARLPEITPHWCHIQISCVNDMVLNRLGVRERKGWRWHLLAPLVERLMIAWCGLHSSVSDSFSATLVAGNGPRAGVLKLAPVLNPRARSIRRRMSWAMFRRGLRWRSIFVPRPVAAGVGGGNHFGGCFPMRRVPSTETECDVLGRLPPWKNIHIVDGSVLPSLPATTVALLIMANADRIAGSVEFA